MTFKYSAFIMAFEFIIPLNVDDLLHSESVDQYVVQEVASLRELPNKIQLSGQAQAKDGCSFILDHFDTLYSFVVRAKELEVRDLQAVLHQSLAGLEHMAICFPDLIEDDMHAEQQKKLLNMTKMTMFIFWNALRIVEDKILGKDMLFDIKGRKKTLKSAENDGWDSDRNRALFALYNFLQLPLHKLWNPPVAEEEFVSMAANVCYKILEDPSINSVKMKPMRESIFQVLGTLVSRYQHGLSCTVKIVQLLKLFEHLCAPLAECVIALVQDYGCRGFLREIVREISESDSIYDMNGARTFSLFLTEIAKNASDLVLPIISLLLPHLDNDPYTMRNCVLEIMGEVVVQILSVETMDDQQRETRNMFLDHLQDHLLDNNAYVRAKALKIWQRLAQEKSIPLSRFGDLLGDVVVRLGDTSWTVVRYAVQLVKTVLQNNPFGAKMDLATLKEKLDLEEKAMAKLKEEACDPNNMSRIQRWELHVPSLTLAVEQFLKPENTEESANDSQDEEPMSEGQMMSNLTEIRSSIDKKDFESALKLVCKTEKIFSGASELRKDKRLEWQVDYYIRLIKKIYVEMNEEVDDEDKENKENLEEGVKKDSKKSKKRRLQDLHPSEEEEKHVETEVEKAIVGQTRVLEYLKDCIAFVDEMDKAISMITALLHSGQIAVVQDAIEFLTTASVFGFDQSETGIRQMLLLVWCGETAIKEAVASAYKTLFLDIQEGVPKGRAQAVEIVRNLSKLLKKLGQNEKAALEVLVMQWVSSDAIDKSCIQVMWERFTRALKDTSPDESRAALQLLTMVAAAKVHTVQTNVDVLVKAGMGVKGERNSELIHDTCRALLKLTPVGRATTDAEPLRYPRDHDIFQALQDVLKEGFTSIDDSEYQSMAEEALDVIYQLSENPDVTSGDLLKYFVDQVMQKSELRSGKDACTETDGDAIEESKCSTELLTRLVFFIGHVAYRQWVHLDKFVFRELKRRNNLREKYAEETKDLNIKTATTKGKKKKGSNKDDANESLMHSSILSASHSLMEKQEDELGADIAADDAEAEYINNVCESEVVTGDTLLSKLSSIVVSVCANPQKFTDDHLQATASLSLTKLMLASSEYCEKHLQLVFTMMEKSVVPQIRSNLVYAMGDLANRFPNLIEPWTKHFYSRLSDKSSQVRQDTILVLKHLITNEMLKVRGQISDLALCIVDPEPNISSMAILLFQELAKKGNTLYNVMPDIISRLSNPSAEVEEEKFQAIMKFLMQLIQKDRQMESLVDKLCQRFRASTHERQWSDLAFCLGLMQFSDRSLRRLLENLPCYAEKLTVQSIYDTFCDILEQAGKTQKPERLQIIEELEAKINECLQKGLPEGNYGSMDSGTAGSQDSDDGFAKPKPVSHTPNNRRKIVPRTPATTRSSRRGRGRGRGRGKSTNPHYKRPKFSSSSEESSQSESDDDEVFIKQTASKRRQKK